MKRSIQLKTCIHLIQDLNNQPHHLSKLANKYNMHYRTIYRYVNALKECGFKIGKDTKGYHYIQSGPLS